jgi:Nucleotidyl transferase AbiEii toxin, Type IV TA system
VQAHGLVDRPSEDIDLFTTGDAARDFAVAVRQVMDAYEADGLSVLVRAEGPTFARLEVNDDSGQTGKVEMAVDWRAFPPVRLDVGPVLHRDDAVANKVTALYGRYEPRDFIDVDAVLLSGHYSREDLLRLAVEHDPGFEPARFAESLAVLEIVPDAELTAYGLPEQTVTELRARFADWRASLAAEPKSA